jgi:heme-binding NEAT domain protein
MKEFLKMFVLTLPVYILLFFLFTRQDKLTPQDVINQLNQRDSIISKMIDKQGRLVVEHTNREYSPIILKTSNEPEFVQLREELSRLGIKMKDLNSSITLVDEKIGSGETKIFKVNDTLDVYSFADTTKKNLKLKGVINLKNGDMFYDYTYSAKYSILSYDYKKNIFRRPELRLKIVSDDSTSNIKAQTFNVKTPKEIVSIGAGIGASVVYDNGFKVRPAIQIGIFKSIITFRTKN